MIRKLQGLARNTIKIQRNFCQQKPQQKQQQKPVKVDYEFDQTKLKHTFLGAVIGGCVVGSLLGYYLDFFGNLKKAQKQEQLDKLEEDTTKTKNMEHFTAVWQDNWDGKQEQYLKDQEQGIKRGTKYITLIRHGQYHTEAEEKDLKVLTKLGEEQAKKTGTVLKQQEQKFDKIYVSDLIRSKQTGEFISKNYKGVPIIEDSLLSEGFPAPVSPVVRDGINKKYKKDKDGKRISDAFEKYFQRCDSEQDEHELHVIHANVIRYFLTRVLQFPVEGWLRLSNAHCGITQIEISPSGYVSVKRFGDSGHLKKEQVTTV